MVIAMVRLIRIYISVLSMSIFFYKNCHLRYAISFNFLFEKMKLIFSSKTSELLFIFADYHLCNSVGVLTMNR